MAEMNLCINCAFHKGPRQAGFTGQNIHKGHKAETEAISPVDGSKSVKGAVNCTDARQSTDGCGPKGRFWSPASDLPMKLLAKPTEKVAAL